MTAKSLYDLAVDPAISEGLAQARAAFRAACPTLEIGLFMVAFAGDERGMYPLRASVPGNTDVPTLLRNMIQAHEQGGAEVEGCGVQ